MTKGKIIFINGVSSAGKTTLTKCIQKKLNIPFYHICCDDFMNMTPAHILNNNFDNQLLITQGIMHEVIKLFSDKGHNVIVDDVVLNLPDKNDWMFEYVTMFKDYPVFAVRVDCPVEELERRESIRGNRNKGMSKWQLDYMDLKIEYDLVVNTYSNTTDECADLIISKLHKQHEWKAFESSRKNFLIERRV
jgi:chloramphenicol 3-O phosphotransferase